MNFVKIDFLPILTDAVPNLLFLNDFKVHRVIFQNFVWSQITLFWIKVQVFSKNFFCASFSLWTFSYFTINQFSQITAFLSESWPKLDYFSWQSQFNRRYSLLLILFKICFSHQLSCVVFLEAETKEFQMINEQVAKVTILILSASFSFQLYHKYYLSINLYQIDSRIFSGPTSLMKDLLFFQKLMDTFLKILNPFYVMNDF